MTEQKKGEEIKRAKPKTSTQQASPRAPPLSLCHADPTADASLRHPVLPLETSPMNAPVISRV